MRSLRPLLAVLLLFAAGGVAAARTPSLRKGSEGAHALIQPRDLHPPAPAAVAPSDPVAAAAVVLPPPPPPARRLPAPAAPRRCGSSYHLVDRPLLL